MPKAKKFGTFGGVFTPSILTILGVIMYLRFPQIIGQAGLFMTIGIVIVAHIISITTGLSVASIATDKKVKSGGTYYMISRSLGLPIGGTLGLALFVGLSFSVSLYLIGFAESFLNYFNFETTKNTIRIVGTIILVLVTTITFISTSLAIKSQYFIMAAIALSLISIFFGFGSHEFPAEKPLFKPIADAVPFMILFGIFFPAVTGFEAGVSMSGDLKDPKKSLPVGAMAAVGVGFITYIGLALFYTFTVDSNQLANDPNVLFKISLVPELVIAGIWGATLSSALGSILGAPRILQATAVDKIVPKVFAKGTGKSNEPRNALLLTFFIAEIGILIGELDVIARIVSMFFITTYAFLNLAAFIESLASSDFRPDFKIPKFVSLLGAVASIIVMILLDFVALIGAVLVLGLLLFYIRRKQLVLKSGDAWNSFASTLVKNNISKLSEQKLQIRNWLPNILLFTTSSEIDIKNKTIPESFIGKLGMLTNIFVKEKQNTDFNLKNIQKFNIENKKKGVFYKELQCSDIYDGISAVSGIYGFSGVEPNTILLCFNLSRKQEKFKKILKSNITNKLNTIIFKFEPNKNITHKSIDFWWKGQGRHLQFAMSLMRLMVQTSEFADTKIRILIINQHGVSSNKIYANTNQMLDDYRINAEIKIIDNSIEKKQKIDIISTESANTDIVMFGISDNIVSDKNDYLNKLEKYNTNTILLLPSDNFETINSADDANSKKINTTDEIIFKENFELPETKIVQFNNILSELYNQFFDRTNNNSKSYILSIVNDYKNFIDTNYKSLISSIKLIEKSKLLDNRKKTERIIKSYNKFLHEIKTNIKDFEAKLIEQKENSINEFIDIEKFINLQIENIPNTIKTEINKKKFRIPAKKIINKKFNIEYRLQKLNNTEKFNNILTDIIIDNQNAYIQLDNTLSSIIYLGKGIDEVLDTIKKQSLNNNNNLNVKLSEIENYNFSGELQKSFIEVVNICNTDCSYKHLKSKCKIVKNEIQTLEDTENIIDDLFEKIKLINNSNELDFQILQVKIKLWDYTKTALNKLRHKVKNTISDRIDTHVSTLKSANITDIINIVSENNLHLQDIFVTEYSNFRSYADTLEELITVGVLNKEYEIDAQEIPVKKLINYRIEIGYYESVLKEIIKLDFDIEKKLYKTQDIIRLFNFNYENIDNAEDTISEEEIKNNAINELSEISENILLSINSFATETTNRLVDIFDGLHSYSLIHIAKKASGKISKLERNKIFTRFAKLKKQVSDYIYDSITKLIYRKSDGVIFAEKLTSEDKNTNQIQKISQLVDYCSPNNTILASLPVSYKNLFSHKFMISEGLRIERKNEISKAEKAVNLFNQNLNSAIMITGEHQSGKTVLAQQIASKFFNPQLIIKIRNSNNRFARISDFKKEFKKAFGTNNTIDNILQNLPEKHLVIIDNLELWWMRADKGYSVIDYILELIFKYGNRHLFILTCNTHTYNFLNKLKNIDNYFNAVVECEPVDTEKIKNAILLRHRSGGIEFKLENKPEGNVSGLKLATFFNSTFDLSGGNIGFAINSWLSEITSFKNKTININRINKPGLSPIENLNPNTYNLLLQFILHKTLSISNLIEMLQGSEEEIIILIESLIRSKIISKEGNNYVINRYFIQYVIEVLKNKKIL